MTKLYFPSGLVLLILSLIAISIYFVIFVITKIISKRRKDKASNGNSGNDSQPLSIWRGVIWGWLVAFLCIFTIRSLYGGDLGKIESDGWILMIIISLIPGGIFGAVVTNSINNKNKAEMSNANPSIMIKEEKILVEQLTELKDLLDKGILTQEEFDEQKKKILNK